jgi:hypothetical protein
LTNFRRASLSHGTPPHIHRSQWDVPLPDSNSLLINSASTDGFIADARVQGGRSFIALCQLTVVLGGILSLLYTVEDQTREQACRALRRHETALDQWEEGLPPWLCPGSLSFNRKAAGALNLQLCYLVVRMCLWRIGLLVGFRFIYLQLLLTFTYQGTSSVRRRRHKGRQIILSGKMPKGCPGGNRFCYFVEKKRD